MQSDHSKPSGESEQGKGGRAGLPTWTSWQEIDDRLSTLGHATSLADLGGDDPVHEERSHQSDRGDGFPRLFGNRGISVSPRRDVSESTPPTSAVGPPTSEESAPGDAGDPFMNLLDLDAEHFWSDDTPEDDADRVDTEDTTPEAFPPFIDEPDEDAAAAKDDDAAQLSPPQVHESVEGPNAHADLPSDDSEGSSYRANRVFAPEKDLPADEDEPAPSAPQALFTDDDYDDEATSGDLSFTDVDDTPPAETAPEDTSVPAEVPPYVPRQAGVKSKIRYDAASYDEDGASSDGEARVPLPPYPEEPPVPHDKFEGDGASVFVDDDAGSAPVRDDVAGGDAGTYLDRRIGGIPGIDDVDDVVANDDEGSSDAVFVDEPEDEQPDVPPIAPPGNPFETPVPPPPARPSAPAPDAGDAGTSGIPADVEAEMAAIEEFLAAGGLEDLAGLPGFGGAAATPASTPLTDGPPTPIEDAKALAKIEAVDEDFSPLELRDRVVIMLLFKQVVQIEEIEAAWHRWRKMAKDGSKEPLWRVLATHSGDREKIYAEAAQVYAFKEAVIQKKATLKYLKEKKEVFTEPQWAEMRKLSILPIAEEPLPQKKDKRIIFVTHDPTRAEVNQLMRDLKIDTYELQYTPEAEVKALISEVFPRRNEYLDRMSEDPFAVDLGTSYNDDGGLIDDEVLEAEINRSSLINLFEASLVEAVREGASDIHIFPNTRKQVEIHFRIDGELTCWHVQEHIHPEAFLAVVKDNALNVDRFERDSAQDGYIQRVIDDTLIRYRVSVLPIANANHEVRSESIVIRVLDDRNVMTDLKELGLLELALQRFDWAIRQPHGMVILTGPTGSGKSTTLYAALHQVVTPKRNILTVEDPVEYMIPGVRQIKLSHKLELQNAIRAILRHDPDTVMVGEMRDRHTAELAIKLANTGHLTFSTLHTNDAPSAVSRLYKMGIEPFLIAYAINLVVAQRLIRKLCPTCKRPEHHLDTEVLERLGFTREEIETGHIHREGTDERCPTCGGLGFKGRRAITETMPFSKTIRRLIVTTNEMIDEDAIREQAIKEGMLTLRDSARQAVIRGETSIEEMIRVTAGEI